MLTTKWSCHAGQSNWKPESAHCFHFSPCWGNDDCKATWEGCLWGETTETMEGYIPVPSSSIPSQPSDWMPLITRVTFKGSCLLSPLWFLEPSLDPKCFPCDFNPLVWMQHKESRTGLPLYVNVLHILECNDHSILKSSLGWTSFVPSTAFYRT